MPLRPMPPVEHNWWKYLLVFFGGFFTCLIISLMVASIAANAAPVGSIASLIQGIDPNELINPLYQDLTVMEFVKEIVTAKP